MHHRIFLCAAFLLFSCGCRNGSLVAHGETVISTVPEVNRLDVPVKPILPKAPVATNPCATAACTRIYCPNSLPPIPSQGICCPRCVKNPSCNVSACPTYKCVAGIQPANLTAGECCDRCAPISTTTSKTDTASDKTQSADDQSSESSGSSESESSSSSSSSSSSESDEKHGKSLRKNRRLPCFINKFKGKHDGSKIIRSLKKSLVRCRHQQKNHKKTGERLLIQ